MALADRLKDIYKRFSRAVIIAGGVAVLIWFVFFDSYNLLARIDLHSEKRVLTSQNEHIRAEITRLEERLKRGLSDEDVERISREEYGMSRVDETVYPVVGE
ncbi:MAG: septum formation initiator family protein [Bacteroidetes Order II. Incertae sedis bacterium]|jgi:cell division protein FtsB|nr:septum formation initiator family protein [Bacteroidetes Order II. bacterium]MBT4053327.1 septum formation initiator family protein [Bacteroidetes Order II. bacterium]MBT4601594.1 septum formation initiator family protein [Bacteroidetes Order II. bacterium]MBT5249644.1 septum formation initiator family protein [Bacteroidetes Order II. bacterium]MBT6200272.1 septum formation initiator family protein [Bacteroidetes Order II. bacterium]